MTSPAGSRGHGRAALICCLAVPIALGTGLTSCGGGGGGSGTPPPAVNAKPVFSGNTSFAVEEGALLELPVEVTDADGDDLAVSIADTPDAGFFYRSGDFAITAAKLFDFEDPEDANGDNRYELDVSASDGTNTTTVRFTVEVTNRPGRAYFAEQGAAILAGTGEFEQAGSAVGVLGDVDGDGLPEVLVGAPRRREESGGTAYRPGIAYVVSGITIAGASDGIVVLDGQGGNGIVALTGTLDEPFSEIGTGVAGLGDLDGDGLPEIAVHTRLWAYSGTTFIVRGAALRSAMAAGASISLATLEPDGNGLRIHGDNLREASDIRSWALGDLDGDRRDELLVCATGINYPGEPSTATVVVFGETITAALDGGDLDIHQAAETGEAVRLLGDEHFGNPCSVVDTIGDFDGDGVPDIAIGEMNASSANNGRVHVIPGDAILAARAAAGSGAGAGIAASSAAVTVTGEGGLDGFGYALAGAGDFNGDGFDDMLVGAPNTTIGADRNVTAQGTAFILLGSDQPTVSPIAVRDLVAAGRAVEILGGGHLHQAGFALESAGDINADGFADIVVSANTASLEARGEMPLLVNVGRAHVLFGTDQVSRNRIALDEAFDGVVILGINEEARIGTALAALGPAGDLDEDGIPDLIIGAASAETCALGVATARPDTGAGIVVSGRHLLDAYARDGILDLADSLPHLRLWTFGACDKPGLDWLR